MEGYNPFSLEGKTILVTGASSGIGRCIAVECSRMGADVVITARNEERLQETFALMSFGKHLVVPADISTSEGIDVLVSSLPKLNGIVHNAGIGNRSLCKTLGLKDIDETFHINVYAPILLQKGLLQSKKLVKGGSIVFIGSRAAEAPTVGNSIYSASKGAIQTYANVLALELAPRCIRVNTIRPAMVWTDLVQRDAELTGADYEELQLKYPLKRYGKPEDVAYLAVYLLSDASTWMTGSVIDLTGGSREL